MKTKEEILASFENYALTNEEILQAMELYAAQFRKTYVKRSFLLPFKGIMDLERAYKKILAVHQMAHEQTVAKLKANNIPYQIQEPCGVVIDMTTIPEEIKLNDLISDDNGLIEKVYDSVGVIKNLI
jgi:hypothetical protein